MKPITLQAQITGVSTKADNSLSLRISTQELTVESKVQIMEYVNQFGWLLFSPNPLKEEDIPKEQAEMKNKTPGQRLRAVFFRIWEQSKQGDFDDYYKAQMENLIEHFKKKLD